MKSTITICKWLQTWRREWRKSFIISLQHWELKLFQKLP